MRCKGIVAVSKGDVRLIDVDVPDPEAKEVQVRMVCTLISAGTERAFILGLPNATPEYPHVPGYCCAGVVEKCGRDVTGFVPGDRVACYAVDVGHREIGNVPASLVVLVPDGVSFEQAAFASLGQTSLQGVRKCRIEIGESVAVLGLGLVGLLALQLARVNGALPAIGVDRVAKRLEIAMQCGAEIVISNEDGKLAEHIRHLTKGKGPAVVFECTGFPEAMQESCMAAADYARICILGCPRGTADFNFYRHVQKKSITIIGAHAVDSIPAEHSYPNYWTFADDAACFLDLVKHSHVNLLPLISERVSWKEAEKVFQRLIAWDKDALGIVITWPGTDAR